MKPYIPLLLLLTSTASMADGWSDLSGQNNQGNRVIIYPQDDYKDGPDIYEAAVYDLKKPNGDPKIYRNQKCSFKEDAAGRRSSFSCESSGQSPFSGVRYTITPNNTDDFWAYADEYTCVGGCNLNSETPKTMHYGHWEGAEPECTDHKEKEVSIKARTNVRDRPSINGEVVGMISAKQDVIILERDKTCRTYSINGGISDGQWIRILSKDKSMEITGWIFDGLVQYPEF